MQRRYRVSVFGTISVVDLIVYAATEAEAVKEAKHFAIHPCYVDWDAAQVKEEPEEKE